MKDGITYEGRSVSHGSMKDESMKDGSTYEGRSVSHGSMKDVRWTGVCGPGVERTAKQRTGLFGKEGTEV